MTDPQSPPIPRDHAPASDPVRELIDARDAEAEAEMERAVAQDGPPDPDEPAEDVIEDGAEGGVGKSAEPPHPGPEPPD